MDKAAMGDAIDDAISIVLSTEPVSTSIISSAIPFTELIHFSINCSSFFTIIHTESVFFVGCFVFKLIYSKKQPYLKIIEYSSE